MKDKTVVITGGTSGIGEVAAEKLAQMGARIVLVARDKSRGEGTLARLRTRAPNLAHRVHYADLTRISEMKRVATEIAEAEPRIDVLINNAGAMFATRKLTEDGLEFTFALNHMAYFVVTQGLRERLVASGTGTGRQHRIGRASGRFVGIRRSAIDGELRRHESLCPFQALQHSLHA
jgi:short-subunit dehydrogenase